AVGDGATHDPPARIPGREAAREAGPLPRERSQEPERAERTRPRRVRAALRARLERHLRRSRRHALLDGFLVERRELAAELELAVLFHERGGYEQHVVGLV